MSMDPLVPHILIEDEDYEVFTKLIEQINNDIRELIAVFPELVDVDNAPEIFLPKLSALIKYEYRFDIDEDIQREIIKRIISIYRDRGTDDSISMAATYGNDPLWIGSHVFLPGADTNKDRARITHPIDEIFRHDISKFSGGHRYADAIRWRDGTIIIHVSYLDDKIREAIAKVVPAGLRVYFDILTQSGGDGHLGQVVMGAWTLWRYYELEYCLHIKDHVEVAIYDEHVKGRRLRSGRQTLFNDYHIDIYRGASTLPVLKPYADGKYDICIRIADLTTDDLVKCVGDDGLPTYRYVSDLLGQYYVYLCNCSIDTAALIDSAPEDIKPTFKKIARFGISAFSGPDKISGAKVEGPVNPPTNPDEPDLPNPDKPDPDRPAIEYVMDQLFNLRPDDQVIAIDKNLETSYLDEFVHSVEYEISGIYCKRYWSGLPLRSDPSSNRSHKYVYDGSFTGEISFIAQEKFILPKDVWYPVEALNQLHSHERLIDYNTPVEVKQSGLLTMEQLKNLLLHDSLNTGYEYRDLFDFRLSDYQEVNLEFSDLSTEVLTSKCIIRDDPNPPIDPDPDDPKPTGWISKFGVSTFSGRDKLSGPLKGTAVDPDNPNPNPDEPNPDPGETEPRIAKYGESAFSGYDKLSGNKLTSVDDESDSISIFGESTYSGSSKLGGSLISNEGGNA